ncbi:IS6 family transposase [Azospirillum brasilense]|uniref:IS6 family transposase n=1 Tax=Azospirillum brasilense TaxID=192 RepID=UPI00157B6329
MSTSINPYRGFRFPAAIINEAVRLYHCFSLSLREVELILAARGIEVSYETIREWDLRFGRDFANTLRFCDDPGNDGSSGGFGGGATAMYFPFTGGRPECVSEFSMGST